MLRHYLLSPSPVPQRASGPVLSLCSHWLPGGRVHWCSLSFEAATAPPRAQPHWCAHRALCVLTLLTWPLGLELVLTMPSLLYLTHMRHSLCHGVLALCCV